MVIRADDPRRPSEQLAAELREAIEAGEYRPGQVLPSTRQLMEAHGIASMTVQRAIAVLRDEGLVISQPGRGVFVRQPGEAGSARSLAGEPKTLDEALSMLAEVNQRLDRLEAQVVPQGEPAPEPAPEPGPGIEP